MARWSSKSFHFQHYWALLSEGMIDLYSGAPEDGWRRTKESWKALEGSMLLRIQNVRVEATSLRARLALATGRLDEVLDAASIWTGSASAGRAASRWRCAAWRPARTARRSCVRPSTSSPPRT